MLMSVTFQGDPILVTGTFAEVGKPAPDFLLTNDGLADVKLSDYKGQKLVLSIFPSIDTSVCATSVRKFNELLNNLENTKVLCVSADLPFAAKRFCGAENLTNVQTASFFRSPTFAEDYGVKIDEGVLRGLSARAVVVINEQGDVVFSELVKEIADEPNYDAALAALK